MGVLRNLTDEYFGNTFREEDKTVTKILDMCLSKNKRGDFVSALNDTFSTNLPTDGVKRGHSNYIVYEEGTTLLGEAQPQTYTEAHNQLWFENRNKGNFKMRCISTNNLLEKPENYKKYINEWETYPKWMKELFEKLFVIYYENPVFISTFVTFNYYISYNKTLPIPFYTWSVKASELTPKNVKSYGNKDCLVIWLPTRGSIDICEGGYDFIEKMNGFVEEMNEKFTANGYRKFNKYVSLAGINGCVLHIFEKI